MNLKNLLKPTKTETTSYKYLNEYNDYRPLRVFLVKKTTYKLFGCLPVLVKYSQREVNLNSVISINTLGF